MPLDDAGDERSEFFPPLPPEDRLWRHPSEVAAERRRRVWHARGMQVHEDAARSRRRNLVASGAIVLSAAGLIGLVALATTMHSAPSPSTVAASAFLSTTSAAGGPPGQSNTNERPWLGVRGTDTEPDRDGDTSSSPQQPAPVKATRGAVLTEVEPGSPAAQVGLRSGDVVTAVDGHPLRSMADLVSVVRQRDPGTPVVIVYSRDGREQATTVVLGADRGQPTTATTWPPAVSSTSAVAATRSPHGR